MRNEHRTARPAGNRKAVRLNRKHLDDVRVSVPMCLLPCYRCIPIQHCGSGGGGAGATALFSLVVY